jgi:hypothetical protein
MQLAGKPVVARNYRHNIRGRNFMQIQKQERHSPSLKDLYFSMPMRFTISILVLLNVSIIASRHKVQLIAVVELLVLL